MTAYFGKNKVQQELMINSVSDQTWISDLNSSNCPNFKFKYDHTKSYTAVIWNKTIVNYWKYENKVVKAFDMFEWFLLCLDDMYYYFSMNLTIAFECENF